MSEIVVEVLVDDPSSQEVDLVMSCAAGEMVVDACDRSGAPIDFSCRATCCSTCRVQVLAGSELLEAPDEMEQELITASGGAADVRYSCVLKIRDDAAEASLLRIRPLGPAF